MFSAEEIKKQVGTYAATLVQPGMTVGIGTGSTAHWFIMGLAQRVKEGLGCKGIPTSLATERLAAENGIPLTTLNNVSYIDITVDGADEIDPALTLIKGGGGALLREKMVAAACRQLYIIADHTKLVPVLGAFPLPVEVIPFGWKQVQKRIEQSEKITTSLRFSEGQPFMTDHGNYILDCFFHKINEPLVLHSLLNNIPGVVENGLFINMTHAAIIGYPDGTIKTFESGSRK